MNPSEIYEALAALATKPYDPIEFPFDFALATDNAPATIAKLKGGTFNKSDLPGGVLMNQKFHFAPAMPGMAAVTLDALRASKRTLKHKPAILIATDGIEIAAEHPKSGDVLHGSYAELGDRFGFFLPAAGKERYQAAEENPVDVKVSGKLAKLYDALTRQNPAWATEARRHDMNQLMTRLIFCMFAEDVGIFPEEQFSRLIFTHAGDRGEGMREVLISAFTAMNTPRQERSALPAWTREFEYVNGGLFAGPVDAPVFDVTATRYLKEVCSEHWTGINPDVFGSMIQSVADPKKRAELGMHYTSPSNIMKVIGPLFLDELDAEIEKTWDRERGLRQVLDRIAKIRVFDPACGSGNFLVVSYRALREREIKILQRLSDLSGGTQTEMWSVVPIRNFYGIELTDFGAETAKLALFIAEYQSNALFKEAFGRKPADLPLKDAANIVCDNALRIDWERVCPPPEDGGEVFIAGNPPFAGAATQTDEQKDDRNNVFEADKRKGYKCLDLVAAWLYIAEKYLCNVPASRVAMVATSSVTQGRQVQALWPYLLKNLEIFFAHRPFKWRNNAMANAAVDCVIIGLQIRKNQSARLYEEGNVTEVPRINAYLVSGPLLYVKQKNTSLFGLPTMVYGSMPNDGGALILTPDQRDQLLESAPQAELFVRPFLGTTEIIEATRRYCLWIEDENLPAAMAIPQIKERIEASRFHRASSKNPETRERAKDAHRFWHVGGISRSHSYLVASASSERRQALPVERFGPETIASNLCFVLHDAPELCFAMITSRLHLVWVATVCGKLERRYRYSSTLGWHTFPAPQFTDVQIEALNVSARNIQRTRYGHYPATIAELYDPDKMPDDLRAAHKANDDLLESMYIGRPFRNDTERLEHLFKLYAAKIKKTKKPEAA